MQLDKLRIDKWLWAVRIFKTRNLANTACQSGKVKINGQRIKPSRLTLVDDRISVQKGIIKYEFEVRGLIAKRVPAKIAVKNYIDHTPDEELLKLKSSAIIPIPRREKGEGRPTKKARRKMEEFRKQF